MRIVVNLLAVFTIVAIACNKDSYQQKSVLNHKEQEVLFAKLVKDPLYWDLRKATTDLVFSYSKTMRAGVKVDSMKLKDTTEKDIVKRLKNAGTINAEEIRDLSNKQVGLMRQLMEKYPEIRKVPYSDWNTFNQSQSGKKIQL